jgi:glycosyltransferase involved in cell wall biosynthesis
MKFLLVSGIFPPDIGGPATFIPKFAEFLKKEDHEVRILTLSDKNIDTSNETLHVIRVDRKLTKPIRSLQIIWEVLKTPREFRILANGLHEEVGISLLFKRNKAVAKIVGDPIWERSRNNNETDLGLKDFNNSKLRISRRIQRTLLTFALRRFDAITCPSKELCEMVEEWGTIENVKHIANGTEISDSTVQYEKEFDLICVSRLVSWKNIDRHIEIAGALNLKLAIIGSGPEENNLKNLSKGSNRKVTFFGDLSQPEILALMKKSRAFILLSEYEGLSYSLIEALSSGLPAIVSNIDANTQVVRHDIEGVVMHLDKWEHSLAQVKKMFQDNVIYSRYSAAARLRVIDQFEINKQLSKMEELLK